MRISFLWINGTKPRESGQWNDGLAEAMRIISKDHEVTYHDQHSTTWEDCDVILFWEAPCTAKGEYADFYNKVRRSNTKKILLFAGGPIDYLDAVGFDLYLVESELNEKEFEALDLPWRRAFGVNTKVMKPQKLEKVYDGFFQATFAEWKRHSLFAQALGGNGCVAGRLQENDRQGYFDCQKLGVKIYFEQPAEKVADLINMSHTVVNTSSYWGGGQRSVLESIACGVPCIVMVDSVKNSEYIKESGFGLIVNPEPQAIQEAITYIKNHPNEFAPEVGVCYIKSKWTENHYSKAILSAIKEVLKKDI